MSPLLPIILMVKVALLPGMKPFEVQRFETESECRAVAEKLDMSTRLELVLRCWVRT